MASRETLRVGIRKFRENLASFLLGSDAPIVVTRHGDTVGYYIPARRSRSETERSALKEAAARLRKQRPQPRESVKTRSCEISGAGGPASANEGAGVATWTTKKTVESYLREGV